MGLSFMEIPSDIRIKAGIKPGVVYYFSEESFGNDEPHFFVVLNRDPLSDVFIYLTCATSQVEKVKYRIENLGLPQETMVLVSNGDCSIFKKDTAFNCNNVFSKNIEYLIGKLEENKLQIRGELSPEILKKLINGVRKSPEVERKIKKRV